MASYPAMQTYRYNLLYLINTEMFNIILYGKNIFSTFKIQMPV